MLGGVVRGKNVTLRTPREEDLPFFDALMADMRVRRAGHLLGEPAMLATWKERLKEAAKDQSSVLWTIEAHAAPVGVVHVAFGHESPRHVDLQTLAIHADRWGRGLGSDAAIALHRYLFDYLDKRTCATDVAADDERALRLARRLGYTEFGRGHEVYFRDGTYTDQVWLRFDRETWDERWGAIEREYPPFPDGVDR